MPDRYEVTQEEGTVTRIYLHDTLDSAMEQYDSLHGKVAINDLYLCEQLEYKED